MDELNRNASAEFMKLDGLRSSMMDKLERLSQLTIPAVLTDEFYEAENDQLTNGFTSLGSQCVTHLVNKLAIALFAPSRPFFRLTLSPEMMAKLVDSGAEESVITDTLSQGERQALEQLERTGCREALYEGLTHLVVIGNVLMDMSGDDLVFVSLRDYVVKRNYKGQPTLIIIRNCCDWDDLEDDAQKAYVAAGGNPDCNGTVTTYKRIKLVKGMYRESYWVEDKDLGSEYAGKYKRENLPYHALTWRLPLKQNYGVGRVEEYANDLGTNDNLANAMADGAVLASQFKWLNNPAGLTQPEDVTNSPNGAVIPGSTGDLNLVFANIGQQLQTVQAIGQEYQRRLGAGFLLSSAVTRDAERVTAEEIRIQASELESALGGVYSRLALSIQTPLANWLLKMAKITVRGTKIKPVIITGLDALSRSGDLDRMRSFLSDAAALDGIQPQTRQKLNEQNIITDMAAGNGVDKSRYILPPAQQQQNQAAGEATALRQQAAANQVDAQTQPSGDSNG